MGILQGGYLLTTAVGFLVIASTLGCYEVCTEMFNSALAAAHQTGNMTEGLAISCNALHKHIDCLHAVEGNCSDSMLGIVRSTIESSQKSINRSCPPHGQGVEAINCASQYMLCNEHFNSTFPPAMNAYDMPVVCTSIMNYTMCVEQLLSARECFKYANHAIGAVNGIRSQYSTLCPNTLNPDGDMARCMNGTMECYTLFNNTFYPSLRLSNMTMMCSSVAEYSNCIQTLAADPRCHPYAGQALTSIQVLQQQHSTACGEDGGRKATQCLIKFKECYQHFNDTFNPAVQRMDIHKLCESMDDYKACSESIPSDCDVFLGQSIDGLDRMQSQYSQYCTPENKKIFSCSQLSQCNRNLIGNLTMTGAESGMLCVVLDSYFPCVDNAVSECVLSGDGVTAISFRSLGSISSDYCRSVLIHPPIKSCMSFMQCHAGLDLNNISPAMMVEGTYWCHYMESSLMCSSQLLSAGQCINVQNRQEMLSNISALQQKTKAACTLTTPVPVTATTEAVKTPPTVTVTTTKPKDDKPDDEDTPAIKRKDKSDDKKDKKRKDEMTGNPRGAASTLNLNVLTLIMTFTITVQRDL